MLGGCIVFYFYFYFVLRTKIFTEKVHKPINKKKKALCLSCTYLYILINHILINHVFLNLDPDKGSRPAIILRRILDMSQSSI